MHVSIVKTCINFLYAKYHSAEQNVIIFNKWLYTSIFVFYSIVCNNDFMKFVVEFTWLKIKQI